MHPGVAIVKNARRRLTCENASKFVYFCSSRCCFAHAMDAKLLKIVENSLQNDYKKCKARCCNGQKHAPSTDLRKCLETRSFLSLPVLLCSRHGCKIGQNDKFWIRSIQNQRNAYKSWKITEKTTKKFQSTISNAPKRDQNVKNTEKSKRYISNVAKTKYFAKNPVLEPTKIARNRRFPQKILKFAY